jgi:hypothetical protein
MPRFWFREVESKYRGRNTSTWRPIRSFVTSTGGDSRSAGSNLSRAPNNTVQGICRGYWRAIEGPVAGPLASPLCIPGWIACSRSSCLQCSNFAGHTGPAACSPRLPQAAPHQLRQEHPQQQHPGESFQPPCNPQRCSCQSRPPHLCPGLHPAGAAAGLRTSAAQQRLRRRCHNRGKPRGWQQHAPLMLCTTILSTISSSWLLAHTARPGQHPYPA